TTPHTMPSRVLSQMPTPCAYPTCLWRELVCMLPGKYICRNFERYTGVEIALFNCEIRIDLSESILYYGVSVRSIFDNLLAGQCAPGCSTDSQRYERPFLLH